MPNRIKDHGCYKITFGGIIVALCSLGFLAANILSSFSLIIPMYLGFLLGVVTYEVNGRWATLTYFAATFLSVFVSPDWSPLIVFAIFFGYYPIIYVKFAGQKKNPMHPICKLAVFNAAFWLWFKLMVLLVPTFELELIKSDAVREHLTTVLIVASNIFFYSYSVIIESAYSYYIKKFRKTYLRLADKTTTKGEA
jgi:hypothetical protein